MAVDRETNGAVQPLSFSQLIDRKCCKHDAWNHCCFRAYAAISQDMQTHSADDKKRAERELSAFRRTSLGSFGGFDCEAFDVVDQDGTAGVDVHLAGHFYRLCGVSAQCHCRLGEYSA